jgi:ATP-dependent 26S proteasome regulatory subunit
MSVERPPRRSKEIHLRTWEDLLRTLSKRFGSLVGKVVFEGIPDVAFEDIGGLQSAKREVESLILSLTRPELHNRWGTTPVKGVLLYGPPGTGKTLLARALAREAEAFFLHCRIRGIAFRWPGEAGDLFQELFSAIRGNSRVVLYLHEIDALALERIYGTEAARGAGRQLLNTILENLEGMGGADESLVVASTVRPDAVDPALIGPKRLDRLVEVPFPEEDERQEILLIHQRKAEALAGRTLFTPLDVDTIMARTVKMSGADLREIVQRTLEEKARIEGRGDDPGLVETTDVLRVIEQYRKVKEIVEKIRYGQYL